MWIVNEVLFADASCRIYLKPKDIQFMEIYLLKANNREKFDNDKFSSSLLSTAIFITAIIENTQPW